MKRKNKILFLAITFATVLILTSAVNAANTTDHSNDNAISEKTSTPANSEIKETTINKEKIKTSKNNKMEEKTILKENKTDKQTKKDSITIDGIEYTKIIKNQIITEYTTFNENTYMNNSSITVAGVYGLDINSPTTCIINNSIINAYLWNQGTVYLYNTTLNCDFDNQNMIILDDTCSIGPNFKLINFGKLKNAAILGFIDDNRTINNKTITSQITIQKTGNLTVINCNITAKIINNGNLTLQNCTLSNNNIIDSLIENKGNLVMNNSIVENNTGNGVVINSTGNLIFINSNVFNNTCAVISVPSATGNVYVNVTGNKFRNNSEKIELNKANVTTTIKDNVFNKTDISFTNTITNNTFINSQVSGSYFEAYNNTFNNSTLNLETGSTLNLETENEKYYPDNYANIHNNIFQNSNIKLDTGCIVINWNTLVLNDLRINNTVYENTFTGKNNAQDTITINKPLSSKMTWVDIVEISNNKYNHTTINGNITLDIPDKIFVNDNITGTYTIKNPQYYDTDILNDISYDIYIDDTLIENREDIFLTLTEAGEHTIKVQPSISSTIYTKTIEVLPQKDIIITPENYDTYIKNDALTKVKAGDRVLFQGTFTNKIIFIDTDEIVIDGKDAEFINSNIILESDDTIIQNMNMQNTQTTSPLNITGKYNTITNNNINITNTEGPTAAIKNTGSYNTIKNNKLYVDGPATSINYDTNPISNTQAILLLGGNKNTIQNNTITVTTTQESEEFGTIEGITANAIKNTIITQNTIHASNAKFSYGINTLSEVTGNQITENNITVTSYRYCDGIQVGNNAENILIDKNQINIYCHNTTPVDEEAISYGIIATNMGQSTSTEITIKNNNITINSTIGYGIEIYKTTNTQIYNNNILVTGAYSMGMGFSHSPESKIQGNHIRCIGDSTIPIGQVTEEIQPATVGIQIQQESDSFRINNNWTYSYSARLIPNIIHTYDTQAQDICINIIDSQDEYITNNALRSTNATREKTIKGNTTPQTGNYEDRIYTQIETNIPETIIANNTIQLNITLKDEYQNPINKTQIYIILQIDETPIQLEIENGQSTYTWTPETLGQYNITIYNTESIQNPRYYQSTVKQTINIIPKPISHTNTTTENLTLGDSTTLTAQFYNENYEIINEGKVIFKVNGKTIRDNNGNVIYAEIVDGQATLPDVNITQEWMKPDTTIQAVYVGNDNNEPITTKPTTINVTKPEATITLEAPTEATAGTTITLKATVSDGENNITSGRVAFKLNGKTLKDPKTGKAIYANVENGIATITYTIPEKTKVKEYTLTAVFTDNKYDRVEAESKLNVVKA